MKIKRIFIFIIVFQSFFLSAQKLTLNELFNEGVVLQQKSKVLVYGNATPFEEVKINIQNKSFSSEVTSDGKWTVTLNNLQAGGPYLMTTICGNDTVKLNEVYVGEVWIAGGQSNMGWTLEKSVGGKEEIASANNKNIRFVMVPVITYRGQKTNGDMLWRTATTENISQMSGVAYFFAKELQKKLNVPVGIICCYKGGTAAEVWMNRETLMENSNFVPIVTDYENYVKSLGIEKYNELYVQFQHDYLLYKDSLKSGFENVVRPVEPMGDKNYKRPYVLYDYMLKRILPFTSKGIIWYQGEANAQRAEQYQTLFPALINEWRKDFKNPNIPFLFVQLANYDHPAYGNRPLWAELREAQLLTWQHTKNTAMVVTMDVGEKNTIHPTDKKPVGERLAACAFNKVYGMKNPYSGPIFENVKFEKNEAVISFDFVYSGLTANGDLKGFTICGKDEKFFPAKAEIKNNKVIVSSNLVNKPVAVRYSWSNWSEGNLKNKEGFPASPFRTDNYELLTKGVKSPKY